MRTTVHKPLTPEERRKLVTAPFPTIRVHNPKSHGGAGYERNKFMPVADTNQPEKE